MKRMLVIVAAFAVLAPLAANAQERMSDSRYLAASRCLAYADLEQLQSDPADFSALREAAEVGRREPWIETQARRYHREARVRANSYSIEALRERRESACASFVERGLVQLGSSSAS